LVGPDTKLDAALEQCRQAVDLDGSDRQSQCLLAYLCHETGRADEAAAHYSEALRLEPAWPDQTIRHAWNLLLAASRDPSPWTATLALVLARQACQATREPRGEYLDTLAFAEYTNGHVPQAIEAERKALTLVSEKAQPQQYQDMKARLARFESAAH
jgi:tetratricopeptide (TPR) repeat protein